MRSLLSAFLGGGLAGLSVSLIGFDRYGTEGSLWKLLGMALLIGLGGSKAADKAIEVASVIKSGLHITISRKDGNDK